MLKQINKFKKGAASFYIVAFSTLVLLVVATGFAAVIVSEIERTSNDDLSQSAYDSALAGVEDAKLAFYSYQNCVAQGDAKNDACNKIVDLMKTPNCDMVGKILGRNDGGEVSVQEASESDNNMQQAYTCVKVQTILDNYKSTLSSSVQTKAVKVKFDQIKASKIAKVKISWYSDEDRSNYRYTNFPSGSAVFPKAGVTSYAVPPTISLALVQTAENFNLSQFDTRVGNTTNRGMIYLVPTNGVKTGGNNTFSASNWNGSENTIGASALAKSNDKAVVNKPYAVNCPNGASSDFACSALIDLPNPVGGDRSDDTFMFVVSLPYGKPTTTFSLEFFCNDQCTTNTYTDESGKEVSEQTNQANLSGVQVEVDSTGRANDLYRRIETRLESGANDGNLLTMGPLELTGGTGSDEENGNYSLKKDMTIKCEYNFGGKTC